MPYQLPKLAKAKGLVHRFSTKHDGNQQYGLGDPKWVVIQNRAAFLRKVFPDIAEFPFHRAVGMSPLQRGHEEEIVIVGPADAGRGMVPENSIPCEALVTNFPDLIFFCHFGDCVPLFLFDQCQRVLALVHAGRESTIRKIPEKTLAVMRKEFSTDPTDVIVGMGPGFRSHSLKELPASIGNDALWRMHCHLEGREFAVNLFSYNLDRLMSAGVPEENIEECLLDTYTCTDFFSHRRSAETREPEGRHACAVGMVG